MYICVIQVHSGEASMNAPVETKSNCLTICKWLVADKTCLCLVLLCCQKAKHGKAGCAPACHKPVHLFAWNSYVNRERVEASGDKLHIIS